MMYSFSKSQSFLTKIQVWCGCVCVCVSSVAGPRKKDHVRIVSTTARDPEEVLEDLLDEAEALPMIATGAHGEKTTTLLVCPSCASLICVCAAGLFL